MLPWNSPRDRSCRHGRVGIIPPTLLIVAAILVIGPRGLSGQHASLGVLQTQPRSEVGVPMLPPNALTHRRATYQWGDRSITVMIVQTTVVPGDWTAVDCSLPGVLRFSGAQSSTLFRIDFAPDQVLLLHLTAPQTTADTAACRFAAAFLTQYRYFLQLRSPVSTVPPEFPAILEIR